MNFLYQKLSGITKRMRCLPYGISYIRNSGFKIPGIIKVNGTKHEMKFIDHADKGFVYEFTEICLNDCYGLKKLRKLLPAVHTIIDVGANQGLFLLAARQNFPSAALSGYEPNTELKNILSHNAGKIKADVYYEAVTKKDTRVKLEFGATDLHTQAHISDEGDVTGTSFKRVIERANGRVDILKLDCEGAEWDLFEDREPWKHIRSITMEYHLWAKKGSSVSDINSMLNELNFEIISSEPLTDTFGLITAINRQGV